MLTVLLGIGVFALFFILMAVRLILIKDGKFKGTCASQSPYLNKEGSKCGFCGKTVKVGDICNVQESEVDNVMAKFD